MPLQVQIHTGRKAQQRIVGRSRLGVIHAIEMILPEIIFHTESEIGTTEVAASEVLEIVAQVHIPSWGRNHRQIPALVVTMQLTCLNNAQRVLEVKGIDRMQVDADFATHKLGITLAILIGRISFGQDSRQLREVDVVRDAIGEKGCLQADPMRGVIHAKVELLADLGLEPVVAEFILDASLVDAIGRQFADRRRTEAACPIDP